MDNVVEKIEEVHQYSQTPSQKLKQELLSLLEKIVKKNGLEEQN
jgi:hypothetical protein